MNIHINIHEYPLISMNIMNHITEFEVFERLTVIDLNQCRSSGFASAGVVFFSAFSKKPQMVK